MGQKMPLGCTICGGTVEASDLGEDLVIEAEFTASDYLMRTPSRVIFRPSLLGKNQNRYFTKTTRKLPISLRYPYLMEDRITFQIPEGFYCEGLPEPVEYKSKAGSYSLTVETEGDSLVCRRQFYWKKNYFGANSYPLVRALFEAAREGDQVTVMLKRAGD